MTRTALGAKAGRRLSEAVDQQHLGGQVFQVIQPPAGGVHRRRKHVGNAWPEATDTKRLRNRLAHLGQNQIVMRTSTMANRATSSRP